MVKRVNKIQHELQSVLDEKIKILLKKAGLDKFNPTGYIVDQEYGKAWSKYNLITIPLYAYKSKKKGYFTYYIAHELSHIVARKSTKKKIESHGKEFYKYFNIICPKKYKHYELDYKPSSKKYIKL